MVFQASIQHAAVSSYPPGLIFKHPVSRDMKQCHCRILYLVGNSYDEGEAEYMSWVYVGDTPVLQCSCVCAFAADPHGSAACAVTPPSQSPTGAV